MLLRIGPDGTLDTSFGAGGISVVNLGDDSELNTIVIQTDGKLAVIGTHWVSNVGPYMIVARFHSDGSLDKSFEVDGVGTADFGEHDTPPFSLGFALTRQFDGKYVAVGPNSSGTFGAARFDDDAAFVGRIGLTGTSQEVNEATGAVTFTVRRTGGSTGTVTVDYATAAGEALPGADYVDLPGTLNWADGDASDKTITVNLIDDADAEHDETFSLTLSTPAGGPPLGTSIASATIVSEDGPGEVGFAFDRKTARRGFRR